GGPGPALGAHRHSSTDAGNSHRARLVALACEIVGEDYITGSKTARGAIADPDFHLPRENKNVLSPGRGVPIAEIVCRETAEHEIGTRPKQCRCPTAPARSAARRIDRFGTRSPQRGQKRSSVT